MTKKVVLFSGGRTSGRMLRLLMDDYPNYTEQFLTIFCNTGKEMDATLDFVHEVERCWGVPIVWLEYTRTAASNLPADPFPTLKRNQNLAKAKAAGDTAHWFRVVSYESASRDGRPFDELLNWMSVLPNVVSRGCSTQLKIRTAMRYLFSLGVKEYEPFIGIRKDEAHRSLEILSSCDSFEHPQFPLIEAGIDEQMVLDFWKSQPFDLQLKPHEGNCDFCFLKAKWKRVKMAQQYPNRLSWWLSKEEQKAQHEGQGKYFRLGEPYELIRSLAQAPQQSEFCWSNTQDIPCSCAEKGFGNDDET